MSATDEEVEASLKAWAEDCGVDFTGVSPEILDMWRGNVRAMLAAAEPLLRERIAQKVEAVAMESGGARYSQGLEHAAHIVRGVVS